MSLLELSLHFRRLGAGEYAIWNALRKRGYESSIPRSCPLISESLRAARIFWGEQHLNWHQQWLQVLWSDETWINDGRTMSGYVTRKVSNSFIKS